MKERSNDRAGNPLAVAGIPSMKKRTFPDCSKQLATISLSTSTAMAGRSQ
jgi:hypothetical protein